MASKRKNNCPNSSEKASKRKNNRPNSSENGTLVLVSADGGEKFTFFYGKNAPFSNFLPSKFTINNVEFGCTEQYFHYKKAEHFGDNKAMTDILNAENPADQKRLGRKVQGYVEEEWKKAGPIYMKEACLAKFMQNEELKKQLLETSGTTLVEASPRDRKWGIGMGLTNPSINDRKAWRGKNWLGTILMEVRTELANQE